MQRPNRSSTLHRSRSAALIALIWAALFLACIPAATARSDRERPSSESTQPAQSGEPSSSDQTRKDKSEGSSDSSSPEAPPAKSERRSRRTAGGTTSESGEASSEATATTPATRHSGGGQRRQDTTGGAQGTSGHGGRRAAREGETSTNGRAGGSANKAAATKGKTGETGGSGETRRKRELAGDPHGSSHVAKGKAKKIEAAHPSSVSGESTGAGSSSSGSSTSSTPAQTPAQASSSASSPAAVTPTASASLATSVAPSIARRSPRASLVKSHRHKSVVGKQAPTSARSAAGSSSTSAAAPVALVAAVHSSRSKVASKHTAPTAGSSPLLGKTITRIVDVVPTPIRLLIVALVALALAMAGRSRLAARRARRAEQQRGELLEDVGLLQAALLPETPTRLGPVGTSSAYRPAAGPAAGGDFYDVFALEDGKLAVIVGDVSGHGRKALPHTALLRFTLRAYLEAGLSPRGAVQTAGAVLDRQLGSSFATVVAATYNPRERRLVYASAGHPPPIILGSGLDAQPLEPVTVCSSPPVGIGMPTGTRQTILSIPGEAQICFFTDGVTEARLSAGELYGSERLATALKALGSNATADELLDCVSHITASRPDDMAACMLHVEGDEAAPLATIEELELTREQLASDRTEQFLLACGIPAEEAAQLMRRARSAVEQSGSVVLEISRGEGAPVASLQQENLAYLQTRHAARQADLRVSV